MKEGEPSLLMILGNTGLSQSLWRDELVNTSSSTGQVGVQEESVFKQYPSSCCPVSGSRCLELTDLLGRQRYFLPSIPQHSQGENQWALRFAQHILREAFSFINKKKYCLLWLKMKTQAANFFHNCLRRMLNCNSGSFQFYCESDPLVAIYFLFKLMVYLMNSNIGWLQWFTSKQMTSSSWKKKILFEIACFVSWTWDSWHYYLFELSYNKNI